jgi:hypothetical protein
VDPGDARNAFQRRLCPPGRRRLTPELAGVRIIILTTFELDEYVFAALRSGAWHYTNATDFNFETVVPGAHVNGNGWREGPDTRGARFTIFWTGGSDCVQADIHGEGDSTIPGGNIGVACPFSSGSGSLRGMHNYIELHTFAGLHSLPGTVAVPFRLSSH